MKIHSLFILRRSGVPIYYKNFTTVLGGVEPTLISSFLTAILDFSNHVIQKGIDVLDMGDLRFFFSTQDDLIYILVTDTNYSVLLIRDRLNAVNDEFTMMYGKNFYQKDSCIEDPVFDSKVAALIESNATEQNKKLLPIRDRLSTELSKGDILAGGLLTVSGTILYSTLPPEFLHNSLRELEIRYKADTNQQTDWERPKLILQLKNHTLFCQTLESEKLGIPLLVILLFDARTNLGMCDFTTETTMQALKDSII